MSSAAAAGLTLLQAHPELDVTVQTGLSPDALRQRIAHYEGLIVRSATQVPAALLDAAIALKVIGRAGVGVDNIDVDAATRRGIVVLHTPVGNANAAAEHTIALLLALARWLPQAALAVRAGRWERQAFLGTEVSGTVLGIIGLGRIGRLVAQKAQGLGMQTLACDPLVPATVARDLGVSLLPLPDLLRQADYLTLHTPLTVQTRHVLDDTAFTLMRPGVRIVNCARGGLIDEAALAQALHQGRVAGAALDVLAQEPPAAEHPLLRLPHVLCTPHLGAQTVQAQGARGSRSGAADGGFLGAWADNARRQCPGDRAAQSRAGGVKRLAGRPATWRATAVHRCIISLFVTRRITMSHQTLLLPAPDQPLLPQLRATATPDATLAWLPPVLLEPVYALPSSPVLTALIQVAATRARTLTTARLPQTTGPAGRQPATAPPGPHDDGTP